MSFMSVLGLTIHGSTVSLWLCSKHVNMVPHVFTLFPDHLPFRTEAEYIYDFWKYTEQCPAAYTQYTHNWL